MFESADVSLVFCGVVYFSDIPRAFIHKLRAFIGEPKALFFSNMSFSGCLFRLRMFMWFTDLNKTNKAMLNHRPKTKSNHEVAGFFDQSSGRWGP